MLCSLCTLFSDGNTKRSNEKLVSIKMKVGMKWIHFIRSSFVILKSDILSKHANRFNFDELLLCDRKVSRQNISDQLD